MSRELAFSDVVFLVSSARWTVFLFLIAIVGGSAIGIVITLMRISKQPVLRGIAIAYIACIQGTPLLIQLFLVFFLPNMAGLRLEPVQAAAFALSVNAAAFLAEIWRGSIAAVGRGQWEAAVALGLPYPLQLWLIILPQAVRMSVPPTIGFLVQLLKATALASIIGFVDVTRAAQLVMNATGRPLTILSIVAAAYFALCWPLSLLSRRLEAKLSRTR